MKDFNPEKINPYIIRSGYINKFNCPPDGTVFEKRHAKWYELELILWGEGMIITEGKKLPARRGDVFFRRPGLTVQGIPPYYCYIIVFDLIYDELKRDRYSEVNALHSDAFKADVPVETGIKPTGAIQLDLPWVWPVKQFEKYEELFRSTYEESISSNIESRLFLKSNVLQILAPLYSEHITTKLLNSSSRSFLVNYPKIVKAKQFIDNNINSRFSLSQLAGLSNLSDTFFCRIFKEIVGLTPVNYINKGKINHAKKMLLETNLSIKEISYSCGFENESYFYTLFKRFEKYSPLEFRTRHRLKLF